MESERFDLGQGLISLSVNCPMRVPPGSQPIPSSSSSGGMPKGAGELDHGVHAGDPFAALKLADRRAVQRGAHRQLFLGELRPPAAVGEVVAELVGDLHPSLRSTNPPGR